MKMSVSWFCVVTFLTLILAVDGATLFSNTDDVEELSASNFVSVVHGSPRIWIVDFYAAWCGYCQRVAIEYKGFAQDIQAWKSVVGIAAVACSNPENSELCRKYGVSGYPTIKLFPPNAEVTVLGQTYDGEKYRSHFPSAILNFMTSSVRHGHLPPSWPNFDFVRNPRDVRTANDNRTAYVIVEDDAAILQNIGKMVIMDLLPERSSVVVRRMKKSDAELYGITRPGLFGLTNFNSLFPVASDFNRYAIVETIESHIHAGDEVLTRTMPPMLTTTLASQPSRMLIPGLHMQDIESSLYYSLWIEVPSLSSLNDSALAALKSHVDIMLKFLPAEGHIKNFLNRTNQWLKDVNAPLSASEWLKHINQLQTPDAYVPKRQRWTWCEGSQPRYRGYPCSLWMTFHTLTVNFYLQQQSNALEYSSRDIITSIRGYVQHFLSCRPCAANFGRGAARLLDAGKPSHYYVDSSGPMLWLWMAHNRANYHLRGDVTEDPLHPKIQFPSAAQCPKCLPGGNGTDWNETAVVNFLVQYYGQSYVIDDDIHDDTEFQSDVTTVASRDTTRNRCIVVNSEWTPCSKTCNVGTSVRFSNDNDECRTQLQVRLCLIRPCVVQFPDWTRSAWHVANCPRLGHTYRLSRPQTLSVGQCSTMTGISWRVCGQCPPSRADRTVCCRPARSTSKLMDMECRGTANGEPVYGQILVEVIDYCMCDDRCVPEEL